MIVPSFRMAIIRTMKGGKSNLNAKARDGALAFGIVELGEFAAYP